MIILGDDEAQVPKLSHLSPVYAPPVNRCSTSASSLPDYETSEAQQLQQHDEPTKWKGRSRNYRRWRIAFIVLIVYSVLSFIIGVPLLVVKLRETKHPAAPASQWNPQQASVVLPGSELVTSPPSIHDADSCDSWRDIGETQDGVYTSTLNFTLSPLEGIFLGSNGSFRADNYSPPSISGQLLVDMNDDPSVVDVRVAVSMSYSDLGVKNSTHVCLVDVYDSDGVYIYVPPNLNKTQKLSFNITLLFPQPKNSTTLNITSFATMLPTFNQVYGKLSPSVRFQQAALGGPMSTVTADSIAADNLVVMSSPGEIRGSFEAACQLVLETMSAPITANVTMRNGDQNLQATIRLNTGNAPLNANISLISTSSVTAKTKSAPAPPIYYIDANTFNSPLSLSIVQDPIPSVVSPLFVSAGNNLGTVDVTLDENFQGTFLAHTEYAEANVQDAGDDSSSPVAVISPSFIVDYAGRTLYYDDIDVPSVSGWVGTGTRPSTSGTGVGAPGCVEVVSVLSPVTLQLGRS